MSITDIFYVIAGNRWLACLAIIAIAGLGYGLYRLVRRSTKSIGTSPTPTKSEASYNWLALVLAIATGATCYWYLPTTSLFVLGVVSGLLIILCLIGLAAPLYIAAGLLVNKPNQDKSKNSRSGFHLFTYIETGQVKIVVRGETVVRMIMDTAGKRFAAGQHTNPQLAQYWEIIDSSTGNDENPIKRVVWFLRPWAWYVFRTTGAVFTGIYPFQRVREYSLERTKLSRDEKEGAEKSNLVLEVKEDYSDHYRVRQFLYPMHITGAETRDKIPLDIIGTAKLRVTNPHLAAFGTDRWDHLVVNLITDAINTVTKGLSVDEILTYDPTNVHTPDHEERVRKPIKYAIEKIKDDTSLYGIEIEGFDVSEINPDVSPEELKALRAQAIAVQQAKATRVDGKARADVLRDINAANAAGGDGAIASLQTEGLVRAAEAAGRGGGTVILMPGGGTTDPTQVGILAELQKLNKKGV